MVQNRNQNHLLCAIVFDFMVYSDPKFLIFKTKIKIFLESILALAHQTDFKPTL